MVRVTKVRIQGPSNKGNMGHPNALIWVQLDSRRKGKSKIDESPQKLEIGFELTSFLIGLRWSRMASTLATCQM